MKDTACFFVFKFNQIPEDTYYTSKQLEIAKNRGLDISSCKIGIVDYSLGASTTMLETIHLLHANIKKNNACLKEILDANLH